MAATDVKYLGAISLLLDDEINHKVIDVQNTESLTDILNLGGRYEVSKTAAFHNYVNSPVFVTGDSTGATVTGSGTPTVNTTLTAATSGFVRVGDICKFPNGKNGYVYSVTTASSQDSLVIKSVDDTNLTHVAGDKINFFSNAVGEKSNAPANIRYSLTKYFNLIQIFREVNEITDVARASALRVEFKGEPYIYVKDNMEKAVRLKAMVNAAVIGGQISADQFTTSSPFLTDSVAGGTNVQTTRGLDQYISTYGSSPTVGTPGSFALADIETVISALLALKADISNYMVFMPTKVKFKVDTTLKNLGSSGVTSVRLNIGGNDVNMNVEQFTYGGMTADLKVLPILDHPDMFSQTDIVKKMYFVPKDSVKTADNGVQPRIKMRFMDHGIANGKNLGDRIWGEWYTGALAPTGPTSEESIWRTNWKTHQGLEVLGAQHFASLKVLS